MLVGVRFLPRLITLLNDCEEPVPRRVGTPVVFEFVRGSDQDASREADFCLCLYGSIARRAAVPSSDIDLVLLCKSPDSATLADLRSTADALRDSHHAVSVQILDLTARIPRPALLKTLSMLRVLVFISGQQAKWRLAQRLYRLLLSKLSLEELVHSWQGDCYRDTTSHLSLPNSHHEIKSGMGGVIDVDFASIFGDWLDVHVLRRPAFLSESFLHELQCSLALARQSLAHSPLEARVSRFKHYVTRILVRQQARSTSALLSKTIFQVINEMEGRNGTVCKAT